MTQRISDNDLKILAELEKKVLWLSSWTIHHANHLRDSADGLKVGGHQASSASLAAIMTALYFHTLRPQDRVAVKPHARPNFHAIQYLLGKQTREKLEGFRGYKGAQSYPSRTKDTDDVDFSTGSVGLGVAQTLFSSLVQDYVRAHFPSTKPEGRMVALVGDAEMDEGNIFEAMLEGWKQGLRNCWWVIDYNRQSLDAVIREGLWSRYEALFKAFGWDVVIVKHGSLQEAAFKEPGGEALRTWIDNCPNQLYSALTFQGGAAWRKRLMNELGDQGAVTRLIDKRSDDELARLMGNLGGHDLPALIEAFDKAATHDRPTCFICYTIKGSGLALAGHKDNHAGMMTPAQMDQLRESMHVRAGHEWDKFEGLATPPEKLQAFLDRVPFATKEPRRYQAPHVEVPAELAITIQPTMSTQMGFGQLLNELGRGNSRFRQAHRDHVAGRDGLDQSRAVGEPAQPVRAREDGRHVQERAHRLDLQLGIRADRPAHRARHRGEQSVHRALGARPVAFDQRRAAVPDRHAVRSVHRARPRCAQLRLLPGGALHPGGDAVRHHARGRRRRAPVDRHAADRHGAGRARGVRAGLRRRARRHHGVVVRLHPEGRRRASRPSATGCATRPAARSICGSRRARSSRSSARSTPICATRSSTAPTGCANRGRTARWSSPTPARSRRRRSSRSA